MDDGLRGELHYDTQHGTDPVASALTWRERVQRNDEAARILLIHPNTLAYRLRCPETSIH